MDLSIIYSLGEKIIDNCAGAGSSGFSEYIRSGCFGFIVALVLATIIEAVGLDFLFTGSGSENIDYPKSAREEAPRLEDLLESSQPQPATTLAEIWGSNGPDNITLQDVIE
ncbi:MAG: hypothetical protein FJW68_08170 [Actinobacteria bacterium]|nr:hypothetical protein [Actinomycetota bacterium]